MDEIKKAEKRNGVDFETVFLMLGTAIFVDTIQAGMTTIVGVGWILSSLVTIFAWLGFYLWTSAKGWGMSDTLKKIVVEWFLPLVELIPLVNGIPAWTLKIIVTIIFLKAEDVLYNATHGKLDAEKIGQYYKKFEKMPDVKRMADFKKKKNQEKFQKGMGDAA